MRYYTIILSAICILFFIMQILIPAFTDALILNSSAWLQPWRFVTSIFLHASPSHIIFNLFALILFGLILESVIGSNKLLLVFFVSGILANLIAVNFYSSSLGASGAIYGILGCLTILRPKMTVWVYSLPMPLFIAAIVWVLAGIFGVFYPSNVGDIAHLLGIAVGFLFGVFYRQKFNVRQEKMKIVRIPEVHIRRWEDEYMN